MNAEWDDLFVMFSPVRTVCLAHADLGCFWDVRHWMPVCKEDTGHLYRPAGELVLSHNQHFLLFLCLCKIVVILRTLL